MDEDRPAQCLSCTHRQLEFVVSLMGPERVTTEEICSFDLPGFPQASACAVYECKFSGALRRVAAADKVPSRRREDESRNRSIESVAENHL